MLLDPVSKKLRITDFGIGGITAKEAIQQERQGTMTRGGRLLTYLRGSYSADYASPQQKRGEDPDPRDDIHALGVIGYQMMTGHLLQGAGPDFDEDLREAGANEDFVKLLKDCVASKAERRIASGQALLDRLRSAATPALLPAKKLETIIPLVPAPANAAIQTDVHEDFLSWQQVFARANGTKMWLEQHESRLPVWKTAAEQGFVEAMALLGDCYGEGCGVPQDYAEAMKWLRKAADAGYAYAMINVGWLYQNGRGVRQDLAESRRWYERAHELGEPTALERLKSLK